MIHVALDGNDGEPSKKAMRRTIRFLVFPDFQILDLTGPLAVFQTAAAMSEGQPYRLDVVSSDGGLVASTCGLAVSTIAADPASACDTLIVAGGRGSRVLASDAAFLDLVRCLASQARRTASVCTGAFLLAGAGLLDGRRATTHWRHASTLQRRFPAVRVAGDRIFVQDGAVWSSAGITAGIDLALALVEKDLGATTAKAVAGELVVYHRRAGGQSQFSTLLTLEPDTDRIRRALSHAREHLGEPLPVERLAQAACLSPRQFARSFRAETGETPAKAVERLRVEAARGRIESGDTTLGAVARAVGFDDPERMRRAFLRVFGHPPQALQRLARSERSSAEGYQGATGAVP